MDAQLLALLQGEGHTLQDKKKEMEEEPGLRNTDRTDDMFTPSTGHMTQSETQRMGPQEDRKTPGAVGTGSGSTSITYCTDLSSTLTQDQYDLFKSLFFFLQNEPK